MCDDNALAAREGPPETGGPVPETYPIIEAHLAPYVIAVAGVLLDGVDKATVRDDTPVEQLAVLFVGTLSMLYVQVWQYWGSNGALPTVEEIPALAVTPVLDGAAPRAREETP